ncbi:hypothetical protein AB0G98_21320 [Streptomyces sp. NPDC020196]|uniref:hypothetical protein n=1 Tax=Streptomyces sp. NPDC020196 TaxID=3156656 RepID=UPI0033EFC16F
MTTTPMTPDREQEIRTLDLLELMSDRAAPVISGHLAVLLGEIDRLRDRVAELETMLADATEPDVDGAGRTYQEYYPDSSIVSALKVITKHGDMSDDVRRELRDLILAETTSP